MAWGGAGPERLTGWIFLPGRYLPPAATPQSPPAASARDLPVSEPAGSSSVARGPLKPWPDGCQGGDQDYPRAVDRIHGAKPLCR